MTNGIYWNMEMCPKYSCSFKSLSTICKSQKMTYKIKNYNNTTPCTHWILSSNMYHEICDEMSLTQWWNYGWETLA